ncbi:DUF2961 domain-containing protein [bacterium]|nr:MAG: DUF2961 domain-containing protein [bacterium]
MRLRSLLFSALFSLSASSGAQSLEDLAKIGSGTPFRASSNHEDWKGSNVDYKFIKPGETLTLADVRGSGTIRRIWMTILPSQPAYSRLLTLRIYWDGEASPSVECPIGDFFGVGHGLDVNLESLPVRASAEGRARSCVWPMPFRKSARVTLSNEGTLATWGVYFNVDGEYGKVAGDAPYFHAMYRQEFPCKPGNYLIADLKGRGHYVGTVLSARTLTPGWFGEGDEFFYVDGEKIPRLRGTGLEDYFGEAWALRQTNGAYAGCSLFEGGYPGARYTCYRWHVPDPVRFEKGLKVEIEHKGVAFGPDGKDIGNNNERADEYSSVAFWYQQEPHAPFAPLPGGMDRLPFDYRTLIEAEALPFEKPSSGHTDIVKVNGLHGGAHLEWASPEPGAELHLPFEVAKDGQYQLMVLATKRWDGALAEFLVDGIPVGDASLYSQSYDMHREIPFVIQSLKAGKHRLTIRCKGKAPQAGNVWLGIDGFIVQGMR